MIKLFFLVRLNRYRISFSIFCFIFIAISFITYFTDILLLLQKQIQSYLAKEFKMIVNFWKRAIPVILVFIGIDLALNVEAKLLVSIGSKNNTN